MELTRIESTQNPAIKALYALRLAKERKTTGLFLVEGVKLCGEALKCGLTLHTLLVAEGYEQEALQSGLAQACAQAYIVPNRVLEHVCETKTPQPVVLSAAIPAPKPLHFPLAALDGVQDPGNMGTILRTCDAAGFSCLLGEGCADPYAPKVVRSAMGSLFRVPFQTQVDLPAKLLELREKGAQIVVSAMQGQEYGVKPPYGRESVLVIGSEGRGVSEGVRALATTCVRLPMVGGAESLNASVAAGILLYDLFRSLEQSGNCERSLNSSNTL